MRSFTLKTRKAKSTDFSHHKSTKFGSTPLPAELLFLSPILNQADAENTEDCTAFASVADRYNETNGTQFNPQAQWQEELSFAGVTTSDGFDLEVPLATGVKNGFLAIGAIAPSNKASAYFWVSANSGMDLFDSVRTAMFQMNRPLLAGTTWMSSWDAAQGGVINDAGNSPLGGHCIKLAGWKQINGQPYVVIQNSWGTGWGDQGFFYFSRQAFNIAFNLSYGIGYWSDDPNAQIVQLGFFAALLANLKALYQTLIAQPSGVFPPNPDAGPLVWTDPVSARHAVRVTCDLQGLSVEQKNILCACVEVESNFNPQAIHYNKDLQGNVLSTDYGIAQINDYWNIGEGKPFPSSQYVLDNPQACIEFMCQMWLAGKMNLWCSYSQNLYQKYL